jgi:hypothetical protein
MNVDVLPEPPLEFGDGGQHIDVRHGLMNHGPLDKDDTSAPSQLRVGFIGTQSTIQSVKLWLERCANGVSAKKTKLTNLFPPFPGFSNSTCFKSELIFNERWERAITNREVDHLCTSVPPNRLVHEVVDLFIENAQDAKVAGGGPDVFIVAPPMDLLTAMDSASALSVVSPDEELDEGAESPPPVTKRPPHFHDLLKLKSMRIGIPVQMMRPRTYLGNSTKADGRPLQDEATRAWNLFNALYYKAGGIPWRLVRHSSDLSACFIGVSFFRSLDGDRLLTSVAQVFNERGEGVIVKGGPARIDKEDRQPHMAKEDAYILLVKAIQTYRREHKTSPARVVVHKTSSVSSEEMNGFQEASSFERIELLDLMHVRRSRTRLFRHGTYPPLRGTTLQLDSRCALINLRGSVNFFQSYPGKYIPRPLEFSLVSSETTTIEAAKEMFSLSKLNWNNTQFDGGEPITVRAARRVGDILKCATQGDIIQPTFRFFM